MRLPTFVASSKRGAKKSFDQLITSNGLINIPAVSWNRLWYSSKLPNVTHSAHPLAATTNSISSGRWILSLSDAVIDDWTKVGERNKYSATPAHQSYSSLADVIQVKERTDPEHEHWCTSHIKMFKWSNTQFRPTVHHGQ
jgi:hypothetical protein